MPLSLAKNIRKATIRSVDLSMSVFATNEHTSIDVYAKCIYNVEGVYLAPFTDGVANVVTDDNTSIIVTNAPEGSVELVVIPVPKSEKEAWKWIEDSLKGKADPTHAFDIHFRDKDGNRLNADGAEVTIKCPHCASIPMLYSLDINGAIEFLVDSQQTSSSVTFTTNGSTYYIMADELTKYHIEIKDNPGGDVEVDNSNPKAGDEVTITTKPDKGKVVDKVVVKDKDGNEILVNDNGDGTYTYEQPDSDVIVDVTFKDKKILGIMQTGGNTQALLWLLLLIASGTGIVTICIEQKKRRASK